MNDVTFQCGSIFVVIIFEVDADRDLVSLLIVFRRAAENGRFPFAVVLTTLTLQVDNVCTYTISRLLLLVFFFLFI